MRDEVRNGEVGAASDIAGAPGSDRTERPPQGGDWAAVGFHAVRRVAAAGLAAVLLVALTMGMRGLIVPDPQAALRGASGFGPGLGRSWANGRPVIDLLSDRLGTTASLLLLGGTLALACGLLLVVPGWVVGRALNPPQVVRALLTAMGRLATLAALAVPPFALALAAFVVPLQTGGRPPPTGAGGSGALTTPALLFAVALAPLVALATFRELVWLRGVPGLGGPRRFAHLLRRAAAGVLDLLGYAVVVIVILETVFARPGVGRVLVEGVVRRDGPVVWGTSLVVGLLVLAARLLADLLRAGDGLVVRGPLRQTPEAARTWPLGRIWLGLAVTGVLLALLFALVAPTLAPNDPNQASLRSRLQSPAAQPPFGTDELGRDQFSRALVGFRTTMAVGLGGGLLGWGVGALWGGLAGWLARRLGTGGTALADLLLVPADAVRAVPWLLLGFLAALLLPIGAGPLVLVLAVAIAPRVAVAARDLWSRGPAGRPLPRTLAWVTAAILPLAVAAGALFAATLGFLGLGVQPPTPELGAMLAGTLGAARVAPWLFWGPAAFVTFLLFPWLLLADALVERARLFGRLPWNEYVA